VGNRIEEPSNEPAGIVISQDPAAGDSVEPGTAVDLVLSTGPLEMPDVRCRNATAMQNQLESMGFTNVTISPEARPLPPECPFNENNVADQDPAPGSLVGPDTPITLFPGVRAEPTETLPPEEDD
jgi:beta-lactam-binding protein with PASTA domain